MNKLVKFTPEQIRSMFPTRVPNMTAVESITAEGAPVTVGTIIRNKHGRVNFCGPTGFGFYAGGKSYRDVAKYAKHFRLELDTDRKVFIVRGRVEVLPPYSLDRSATVRL